MNLPEYSRALHLYAFWLKLNPVGRKALERSVERQNPHHGHDTLNALVTTLIAYLQREGE